MKPSGLFAILLSASLPGTAFAQSVASSRAGAIPTVPVLGTMPLLSAPAIAPGLTPALSPSLALSPLSLTASPVPVLPAALAVAALPAAAAPLTPASVRIEAIVGEAGALFSAAKPADDENSSESARSEGAKTFDGSQDSGEAGVPVPPAATPPGGNLTQQKMSRTLYQVASIFAEQYAPIDWKKERFAVDLKREYDKANAAILADPKITTRGFQDVLTTFVASMRDYHVSISYNSTERAKLPFLVAGAEGKHYLAYIDREKLPMKLFPFRVGDEVVAFDGKPTAQAVAELAARLGGNTTETDLRLAELFLTNRRRGRGDVNIPDGDVTLAIRSAGKLYKVKLPWDYVPELIPQDAPVRDSGLLEPEGPKLETPEAFDPNAPLGLPEGALKTFKARAFGDASHPNAKLFADMRAEAAANPFMMGARKSFVPRMGEIIWQTKDDNHFHAYIFKTRDGRKMGFVRIAAYDGGAKEVARFGKIMAKFQKETEALVIDQVSNPGGAVFYLYALASHLTDKTLLTPRHRLIIGESDAQWAAELLLKIINAQKGRAPAKASSEDDGGDDWAGYPVTQKFMVLMVQFAQFILKQLEAGARFTAPTHLWGVADIDPAPNAEERYTKPIVLLTNALDFSGGDFFPAIMQDNKRATILGVRTAGAGGIVNAYSVDQFGIDHLSATGSLAERPNGQPIENLGVTPDIPYEITAKDLRTGFAEYRWKILKALAGMQEPSAPAPAAPAAPQGEK